MDLRINSLLKKALSSKLFRKLVFSLSDKLIHSPWLITPLEEEIFEFKKGIDYPNPIVNLEETRRFASDTLWNLKNDVIVFNENQRILKKHTFGKRINS